MRSIAKKKGYKMSVISTQHSKFSKDMLEYKFSNDKFNQSVNIQNNLNQSLNLKNEIRVSTNIDLNSKLPKIINRRYNNNHIKNRIKQFKNNKLPPNILESPRQYKIEFEQIIQKNKGSANSKYYDNIVNTVKS